MASVTKRPRKKADGSNGDKWVVRYFDAGGARRAKTFDLKKDADAYRRKVEREIDTGDHIAPTQSVTVADAVKQFLVHIDAKVSIGALRPCTGKNYHCAFRQAVLPFLGHRLVLDVTSQHLEEWYHDVVRSKRMEAISARRRIWFIKALFEFCMRRRWARSNPAVAAMKAIGAPQENRIETFQIDDVRAVITAANERRFRGRDRAHAMTRCAVNLAAFCGLRWGEIFGLTIGCYDGAAGVLRIRHSMDGLGNLQEPKTKAGNRDVILPEHLNAMLREFVGAWPPSDGDGVIFTSHNGKPMRASNFRQFAWLPLLERAGVARTTSGPIHFHALRHFAVSWMIENGWPIPDVAATVGHANVAMTLNVYAHVVKSRRQSAAQVQSLAQKLLLPAPDDAHQQPALTHGGRIAA